MTKAPLGAVLRHFRKAARDNDEATDAELLRHFLDARDPAAFEALVRRHGPMVLRVCRRVLGHHQDAEDAFQVTFLLLARQAPSIRNTAALAGWLHGVAYRTALSAKRGAATRRAHEGRVKSMAQKDVPEELGWREVQALLDEEIQALPEAFRGPFVLCQMEGLSREEAARRLGLKWGTLCSRLGRARERLRERLRRRGVELPAVLGLTSLTAGAAPAVVPCRLLEATARVGAAYAAGDLPGGTLSAGVERLLREVPRSMCLTKVKIVSAVLTAVLLVVGAAAGVPLAAPSGGAPAAPHSPPAAGPAQAAGRSPPQGKPADGHRPSGKSAAGAEAKDMAISGRVLTPAAEAAGKAHVAVLLWSHRQPRLGQPMSRPEVLAEGQVDGEGKFRFRVRRPVPLNYYRKRHYQMAVVARADGFGMGFRCVPLHDLGPDVEVRLQTEQIHRGRLIDLGGQPAAGVRVEVAVVGTPAPEYHYFSQVDDDETFLILSGGIDGRMVLWDKEIRLWEAPPGLAAWPSAVTTDAQGRFALRGLGLNQAAELHFRAASGVACQKMSLPARKEDRPPEFTFAMAAARILEGTVTDARTGAPLPGALVQVYTEGGGAPPWPVPADWRGRQGSVGPGYAPHGLPTSFSPAVSARTDAKGRFRLNPFRSDFNTILVSPPDGQPYLTVKKSVYWRRGVAKRTVDVALPRGVPLRGQVREGASGKPVARTRLDFWSRKMPLANDSPEPPDGVFFPRALKTDAAGAFRVVVPPGPWHLLVNAPEPDYLFKKLPVSDLGVKQSDDLPLGMTAGRRAGKKHYYYPDDWRTLDLKVEDRPEPLRLTLRRAPMVRGRLVGPDDKPAAAARMWIGQEPFAEAAEGYFARKPEVKDGRFELALRNPDAPLCVHFLDAAGGLGATAAFRREQAGAEAVTVRLSPCGSTTARFVDARGKPLVGYRPLVWLSLPAESYSSARELEGMKGSPHLGYDTVWAGHADPRHYGAGPRTDAQGRITLPNLIPGATYRIARFDGSDRTFTAPAGKALNLGDVTIPDPGKTIKLPNAR
jgi:RNA polymerase sigma factor (sigma-70 family)